MQKRPNKPRVGSPSTKVGFGGKANWYRGNTSRGAARKGGQESMRKGVQEGTRNGVYEGVQEGIQEGVQE